MTTKHRCHHRYRREIREREHQPAHAHLVGGSVAVLIDLATLETDGAWPRGLRDEVMAWVAQHRDERLEEWSRWHP